eukprot:12267319-Ditylum_brightwellii.AAC.1
MSFSTTGEPGSGDVHMHGFWHDKLLRLSSRAKRHACLTILKKYFQYTKHITGKIILSAFR